MNRKPQLFFDVTYTRTQAANVGITRTVKRLWPELESLAPQRRMEFVPVVFHSGGFRRYSQAGESQTQPAGARFGRLKTTIRELLTGGPLGRLLSASFTLPLRRIAWATYGGRAFDRRAAGAEPVDIAPGDILLSCDASWSYRVWMAASMARQRGAKVVTMVYDLIPLRHPEYCTPLTTVVLGNWLKHQLPLSDLVLCISSAVEADVREYARERGLALGPTATLKLGCDPIAGSGVGTPREAIARFLEPAPCFTSVGSFEPRKNHAMLLSAFERLWSAGVEANLLLMGRPAEENKAILDRIAELCARQPRLMAVFDATDEDIAHAYSHSRALVFPSLAEGFGLPLVEARSRGCLVIASDLPVFAELSDAGVTTYARDSLDALVDALKLHLAADSRPQVAAMKPFTWSDSARACFDALQSHGLVSRAGAGSSLDHLLDPGAQDGSPG